MKLSNDYTQTNMKELLQIAEKYCFTEQNLSGANYFVSGFDDGVVFLRPLADNKTIRVSVGQKIDSVDFCDEVDLFETKKTEDLEKFLSILNF